MRRRLVCGWLGYIACMDFMSNDEPDPRGLPKVVAISITLVNLLVFQATYLVLETLSFLTPAALLAHNECSIGVGQTCRIY